MADISETIAPNSDQLTADDLRPGALNITVTQVSVHKSEDQPVTIRYENCGKKPFKPCKTMRRVLCELWGPNSIEYVGKSLTVYRDDSVFFGKDKTGGVRISHMSHIGADAKRVSVITTRGKRGIVVIKPLLMPVESRDYKEDREEETRHPAQTKPRQTPAQWVDAMISRVNGCHNICDLEALTGSGSYMTGAKRLQESHPDQHARLADAAASRAGDLSDNEMFEDGEAA